MGAWDGEWDLKAATSDYEGFDVGPFALKEMNGQRGVFVVDDVEESKGVEAKWKGVVFQLQAGQPTPRLLYPVPWPKRDYLASAGAHVGEKVKDRWRQGTGIYEHLVGAVVVKGITETLTLFKVERGQEDGTDLIFGFRRVDLDGGRNAQGSVSGVRR